MFSYKTISYLMMTFSFQLSLSCNAMNAELSEGKAISKLNNSIVENDKDGRNFKEKRSEKYTMYENILQDIESEHIDEKRELFYTGTPLSNSLESYYKRDNLSFCNCFVIK